MADFPEAFYGATERRRALAAGPIPALKRVNLTTELNCGGSLYPQGVTVARLRLHKRFDQTYGIDAERCFSPVRFLARIGQKCLAIMHLTNRLEHEIFLAYSEPRNVYRSNQSNL